MDTIGLGLVVLYVVLYVSMTVAFIFTLNKKK